ncbi:MAG: hypothetical protein EOP84_33455 [Verrucomicrobiaceae bacterium]|nr:MAG: hypothetical protein EOP84_33455 [Verrucomicrobiaceae bacterium]
MFPHNFQLRTFGHAQHLLDWLEQRLGPGEITAANHAYLSPRTPWLYDGASIGIKDSNVAMEFRLRWC